MSATTTLKLAIAQSNFLVGDIKGNTSIIIEQARQSRDRLAADVVIFPELSVTGYPPEDLLLRPDFIASAQKAVQKIAEETPGIDVVIGYPERDGGKLYNSAVVCRSGEVIAKYRKRALPNYGVFDEQRYFAAGTETTFFDVKGSTLALTICEDVWQPGLIAKNRQAGADIILTLNASPFHAGKIHQREQIVCDQIKAAGIPLVYVNLIGGQDELVFDGASFVVDSNGSVVFRAEEFKEQLSVVEFADNEPLKSICAPIYRPVSSEYQALVLGIRDYVAKNGFKGALLGLSGGIDSALV